jgi:hypothetical protein
MIILEIDFIFPHKLTFCFSSRLEVRSRYIISKKKLCMYEYIILFCFWSENTISLLYWTNVTNLNKSSNTNTTIILIQLKKAYDVCMVSNIGHTYISQILTSTLNTTRHFTPYKRTLNVNSRNIETTWCVSKYYITISAASFYDILSCSCLFGKV